MNKKIIAVAKKIQMYPTECVLFKDVKTFEKKRSRRAVSDVIATLLMLSITVVGAIMLSAFFQNSGFAGIGESFTPAALEAQLPPSLKIVGYDTRDNTDLSGITGLNNFYDQNDQKLCTKECINPPNMMPSSNTVGTEFIVLKIKNEGTNSYPLRVILVNDVDHLFDQAASGSLLSNSLSDGKFWVINTNDAQIRPNSLSPGDEARIVIKLSPNIEMSSGEKKPDISLNTSLKIYITGNINAPTFAITSGDAI